MKDIVNLEVTGRLGNVLFQTAMAATYAMRYGKDLVLDIDHNMFNSISILRNIHTGKVKCDHFINEPREQYNIDIQELSGNVHIKGYFEKERYFDAEYIRELFREPDEIRNYINSKYGDLTDYVGLSVRRGDFVKLKDRFICLNEHYYEDMYNKYFSGKKIIASSDDIQWAKDNIPLEALYMEERPEVLMYALSHCNGFIGSASTFSWWCAWINEVTNGIYVFPNMKYKATSWVQNREFIPDRWHAEPVDKYAI